MRSLLTGIAIAALAIGTANAKPGGGNGGGGDHGGGNGHGGSAPAMMAGPGGGNGNGNGGGSDKGHGGDHGNGGGGMAAAKADRAPAMARADNPGHGNGAAKGHGAMKAERQDKVPNPGKDGTRGLDGKADDVRIVRDTRNDHAGPARGQDGERVVWRTYDQHRTLIDGCPPGLAKKDNGCMPPGLAKQRNYWGTSGDWWNLRNNVSLSDYRYYDGSMVRLDNAGRIVSYYPLLGGSLIPGNAWPTMFSPSPLPQYYQDYYGLGNDYRYVDGAIYRLDPTTQAIQSIAALLTGDQFAVGQPLPSGYSAYNVPYQYRDQYADGPDGNYRYSDGYVYQVDPTTQLITAAIKLLT